MKTSTIRILILIVFSAIALSCSNDDTIPEKPIASENPIGTENPIASDNISGLVKLPTVRSIDANSLQIISPVGAASIEAGSYQMNTLKDQFLTQLVSGTDGEIMLMGFTYPGQTDFEINATSTALAMLMNLPASLLMAPKGKQELVNKILNDPGLPNLVVEIESLLIEGKSPLDLTQTDLAEAVATFHNSLFSVGGKSSKKLEYSYDPVDIRLTNNEITFVNLGKTYETVIGIYKDDVKVKNINVERITFIPTTIGDAIGAFASAYGGTELPGNLQPVEYKYTFESDGQYDIKIRTSKLADDSPENQIALLNNIINWGVDLIVEVLPLGDCVQPIIADFKQHAQTFGSFSSATTEQEKVGLLYDVLYTFFNQTTTLITCLGGADELEGYLKKFGTVFKFLDLVGKIGNGGNILVGIAQLVTDDGAMDECYKVEGEEVTECDNGDVYVVGRENYGVKVWKNGLATSLTDNGNTWADARSVYVSGTDVYVAGIETNGINTASGVAKVWKNGIATSLTDASTFNSAESVYVSGTDVYVAGTELEGLKIMAKVWKNGVATSLTNGSNGGNAYSVFVSGNDVYVAGAEYYVASTGSTAINVATVWKNGVATLLTDGSNEARATSVYVSGSDVYVAGWERTENYMRVAKVWKNGITTSLTEGSTDAHANSVYVSNNDVYVAGTENNETYHFGVAKVWKNGVAISLTNDGDTWAEARSVYVSGTDVYVAGYEYNGSYRVAKAWKNGVATSLTDGSVDADASSIFVK